VRIRQLYPTSSISAEPSHLLSWSHVVELRTLQIAKERYRKDTL